METISPECLKDGPGDHVEEELDSENYELAIAKAKTLLEMNPKDVDASILGGRAARRLGKFEEAYEMLKFGLEAEPKNKRIADEFRQLQKAIMDKCDTEIDDEKSYNALSMCSQDIYPGDDQLFLYEREILKVKYDVENKQIQMLPVSGQRAKDAAREALVAHGCIASDLNDALRHCSCAIDIDGNNPGIRQLRADIYYQRGEFIAALKDLYTIQKSKRSPSSWKIGGIILKDLDLPVTAEFWFRKATEMTSGKDEEAATLFQSVRVKRLYDPLTVHFPVSVHFAEYGRALIAKENLKPGDIAFEDTPIMHAQLLENRDVSVCDHCGHSLMRPRDYFGDAIDGFDNNLKELVKQHWPTPLPIVCDSCNMQKYCSDECKEQAWNQYHQVVCPTENPSAMKIYDLCKNAGYGYDSNGKWVELWHGHFSPLTLVNMWAMIVCEAKKLMVEDGVVTPTVVHWARAKLPFRKFIAYGSARISETMPEFHTIVKEIFADCGQGVSFPIDDKELNVRYLQAKCNLQTFSGKVTPYHIFMTNLSKSEDMNALRMLQHLNKTPPKSYLAGLFPVHACLNHACNNNVEVTDGTVDSRPGVSVCVRQPIKKGEELFTTYVDTSMPRRLRRAWLYKSFGFWCNCLRCKCEGDDSDRCTKCKKKAEDGKKFPACSKCHRAWYCSVKCQKEAWKNGHKVICQLGHSNVELPTVSA